MFDPVLMPPDHSAYPEGLKKFLEGKPSPHLSAIGNLDLLRNPAIALFCSTHCPDHLAHQTCVWVKKLRDAQIPTISGFHSPVEKACCRLLMQAPQPTPTIHCPARSLHNLRLSPLQKTAIEAQRLLLLSPFPASQKRATATLAERRNRLVDAIATSVFIAYATPGGKTEKLAQTLALRGKQIFTCDSPDTLNLRQHGAEIMDLDISSHNYCREQRPDSSH
ncbi:MAG: DNA-processing protein DprA [Cyanobacteria bacterium J06639_14]